MAEETKRDIVYRSLDIASEDPAIEIVEGIAEMQSKEPDELTPIWKCIDGILDHIFSNPPAPEAQLEITFSYEGNRITIDQEGTAKFVKT